MQDALEACNTQSAVRLGGIAAKTPKKTILGTSSYLQQRYYRSTTKMHKSSLVAAARFLFHLSGVTQVLGYVKQPAIFQHRISLHHAETCGKAISIAERTTSRWLKYREDNRKGDFIFLM